MDEVVPDTVVAIGGVRGSAMGLVQDRVMGKLGVPVENIPGRGKETYLTDTGTNMLQRCRD